VSILSFKKPNNLDRTPEGRKLKMALRNRMLIDGNYTPAERCVGIFIIDHWNERRGYAYPPIVYMVAQLKLSDRVVRSAVEQFRNESCSYFTVKKTGRNYTYYFKPKTLAESAAINTGKKCKKHRQKTTGIPAESASHPYKNPNTINLGEKSEPKITQPSGANAWGAVKRRLTEKHGIDVFDAWFGKLILSDIAGAIVTMIASSKFVADWINQHFPDVLLEAWQCEDQTISQVTVIDRSKLHRREQEQDAGASAATKAALLNIDSVRIIETPTPVAERMTK
jgi:DnaA N-terminal domain